MPPKKWDAFISHASEDKRNFVRPLAVALRSLGVEVWYDEFSLRVGDSLSRSIDKGLAGSRYGIVVISPSFIKKRWPEYELRGLVAREFEEDRVILPVWLGVTNKDVLNFSPPLADKRAIVSTGLTATDVAIQLLREVRPDLYRKHPRSKLEKLANGQAIKELQEEIENAREELAQYKCKYCGAPLSERMDAPVDDDQKHWDLRESYECGYQAFGGYMERPCPSDPKFPKFKDYKLIFRELKNEDHWKWQCLAIGKTEMSKKLGIHRELGRTRKEAKARVLETYKRYSRKWKA